MKAWQKMVIGAAGCLILGTMSSFSTMTEITGWYQMLVKPSWNPPNWLFGPVWTVLYLAMGVAFGLVWHSDHPGKRLGMRLFAVQFALNIAWSFLFFGQHALGLAFFEIGVMFAMIVLTFISFLQINRVAAWLMVPYALWVAFASVLSYHIWMLN